MVTAAPNAVPSKRRIRSQPVPVAGPAGAVGAIVMADQCLTFRLGNLGDSDAGETLGMSVGRRQAYDPHHDQ